MVEEWLNRKRFFTVRGIKHGVNEIDLLGIQRQDDGTVIGWHVEVQASFRPIGYIAKLTKDIAAGRSRTSAISRSPNDVNICAKKWVQTKFSFRGKQHIREEFWAGIPWSYHLVHAVVRETEELHAFEKEGVICHSFQQVLSELLNGGSLALVSGSAGGDLAEILNFYQGHNSND